MEHIQSKVILVFKIRPLFLLIFTIIALRSEIKIILNLNDLIHLYIFLRFSVYLLAQLSYPPLFIHYAVQIGSLMLKELIFKDLLPIYLELVLDVI